jgi:hypothetical protein
VNRWKPWIFTLIGVAVFFAVTHKLLMIGKDQILPGTEKLDPFQWVTWLVKLMDGASMAAYFGLISAWIQQAHPHNSERLTFWERAQYYVVCFVVFFISVLPLASVTFASAFSNLALDRKLFFDWWYLLLLVLAILTLWASKLHFRWQLPVLVKRFEADT